MALVACEKEITIDYHGHDTRYVVEGKIDGSGTEVRVSKTNAMDNNATGSDVDNATVKITADDEKISFEIEKGETSRQLEEAFAGEASVNV